jgi:hypothetical protein
VDERESDTAVQQPSEPPAAQLAAPLPPWRRRPVQLAAAGVLIAAAIGTWVAVGSGPDQIHVRGTLQLGPLSATATSGTAVNGGACQAASGYSDISAGATVTVGGSQGQTLAVGPLSGGVERNVDSSLGMPLGDCVFSFDVAVPGGQSAYSVTISHRGSQTFTPDQVASGIALTLGQ